MSAEAIVTAINGITAALLGLIDAVDRTNSTI
ncbi:hypothetical protein Strvi_9396 (plasmid) [Streptomyces violaceusniger Tu 4113]|uniref:Uncharacterized protein n=1 Tax=Streptomyces violaceusniger (strain Tu 4113) TaxID=653045 RepID=G2PGT9_STRV4|nr:hypothetical protein Strvi_9396 [Streptomyces violaceusniger Tu 4113]